MKISKQRIEQLFNSKASRAVDVIFTQNKINEVHDLYTALIEYKKQNTVALKRALQNNYEKLLYCSDTLKKAKKYAQSIGQVSQQIENQMNEINGKSTKKQSISQSQLTLIENFLRNSRFYQAINKCNTEQQLINGSDRYYIFYLKIDIINKMDRHMEINTLNENLLVEYSNCLCELLYEQINANVKLREGLSWLKDFRQRSLIGMINQKIESLRKVEFKKDSQKIIYEIIFQCKLLMLKGKFKNKYNALSFQQYFTELSTIIRVAKKIQIEDNLSKIFHDCVPEIKSQLAHIFIEKKPNGQILFKCSLYDQLLINHNFSSVVDRFHKQIANEGIQLEHPLKFISQLWHEYFTHLIEHSLNEANPLSLVTALKINSIKSTQIPKQLSIYLYDYSVEQSLSIITEYENRVQLLQKNIQPIIVRCNAEEIGMLKEKTKQKLVEISENCRKFVSDGLCLEYTLLDFRQYLLVRILCGMFQQQINSISSVHGLQIPTNLLTDIFDQTKIENFWNCFSQPSQKDEPVNSLLINFDLFFIGYIEIVNDKLRSPIIEIFKEISMKMLIHISANLKGRQKETVEHTIQSLKQRKEKVAILQTIAVPYLASRIYQCEMKPIVIQKQFFDENFISKETKKPIKMVQMEETDEFEIGQKQEKEELVKVRLGKSIVNFGNNIISGLMMKKK